MQLLPSAMQSNILLQVKAMCQGCPTFAPDQVHARRSRGFVMFGSCGVLVVRQPHPTRYFCACDVCEMHI